MSTLGYLAAWLLGAALAVIGATTVEDRGNWEDLAAAVLGLLGGVLIGHIAWAVVVVRMLRPTGRTGRIVTVVLLTPMLVVVLGGALAAFFPVTIVPLCAIPAALTWWAAEPTSLLPGSTPAT